MSQSPMVVCKGVTVAWRGREVVRDLQFVIDLAAWNYRVPIIGPSGCGKSTLLYGISGMMGLKAGEVHWALPNGGEASWGAEESADESRLRAELRHRRFAFAFQDSALLPHLTVRDNLRYPVDIAVEKSGLVIGDVDAHIGTVLSAVLVAGENVDEVLAKNPRELSGGQRRRVAIAQAMMTNPDVLFLDEPAGGLDPKTKATVMDKINAWVDGASAGLRAVFWVTHHIDDAEFRNCAAILQFRQDERDEAGQGKKDMGFTIATSSPADVLTPGRHA